MESDFLRISNAQLRYYFHVSDPDALSDEEWAYQIKSLEYIRKLENKKYES